MTADTALVPMDPPRYVIEQESDTCGWIDKTQPLTWWYALEASERYYASGRPTRIVEVDTDGRIIREVYRDMANHDWPREVVRRGW